MKYLFLNITTSVENIFEIFILFFWNYSSIIYQRNKSFFGYYLIEATLKIVYMK
jgi:hypothetical protein